MCFPEQACFGVRRQHGFTSRLVALSDELHAAPPNERGGMAVRVLSGISDQMLPAALLAPTESQPHLLLRILTAPPASARILTTQNRSPVMLFMEAVALDGEQVR
jgi:hypothetical protein